MTNCYLCRDIIAPADNIIHCSGLCNMTFHSNCAGFTKRSDINFLQNYSKNINYICNQCCNINTAKSLDNINDLLKGVTERIEFLQKREDVLLRIEEKLDKIIDSKTKITDSNESSVEKEIENDIFESYASVTLNRHSIPPTSSANINSNIFSEPNPLFKSPFTPHMNGLAINTADFTENLRLTNDAQLLDESIDSDILEISNKSSNEITKSVNLSNNLQGVESPKWVFVTRLHRDTTEADVSSHIQRKLEINANSIVCRKLVKRNCDLSTLDFISFKVLIKSQKFKDALNQEFWGGGIRARLFKRINKKNDSNFHHPPSKDNGFLESSQSTTKT